jgi:hypothetical protein
MDSSDARKSANAMQPIDRVKNVHVVFTDGSEVDGFVIDWGGNGGNVASVTLSKHSVRRDEDPQVTLDFHRISSVEIKYTDGRTVVLP